MGRQFGSEGSNLAPHTSPLSNLGELVFLRVLEYYSGILILTTNRVGSFDEAVTSRIHSALYYPPLDDEQSLKIWQMNLDGLDEGNKSGDPDLRVRFDRKEIEDFAAKHWKITRREARWNGRQIKNAFQTAIALAEWDHLDQTGGVRHEDRPILSRAQFKTVAQASSHFDGYMAKVRGTDEFRAQFTEARRDDVGPGAGRPGAARRSKPRKKVREPSSESSDDSDDDGSAVGQGRRGGKSSRGKKKSKAPREESSGESDESSEDGSGTEGGASVGESGSEFDEVEEKRPRKMKSSKKKHRME